MPDLRLNRQILAGITKNHEAIVAFERVLLDVGTTLPTEIEQVASQAVLALSTANSAFAALAELANEIELAALGAAPLPENDDDEFEPAVPLGSMSSQNSDAVEITGGTIGLDAGTVSEPSFYLVDRATGFYRSASDQWTMSINGADMVTYSATGAAYKQTVSTEEQFVSTVVTGTAPLQVASTTLVANLHAATADSLDDPGTYPPDGTDLASTMLLVNYIKSRLPPKGI